MVDPIELLKQNAPMIYNSVMARKRMKLAENSPKHQEPKLVVGKQTEGDSKQSDGARN